MLSLSQEVDQTLTEFLKGNSVITPQHLEQAKKQQGGKGGVVTYLLSQNAINEDTIVDHFASFYGLKKVVVDNAMLKNRPLQDKVTDNFVKKNRIVPFRITDTSVTVIIADPKALNCVNEVKLLTGKSVETLVTKLSSLENYLRTLGASGGAEIPETKSPAGAKASPKSAPGMADVSTKAKSGSKIEEAKVRRSDRAVAPGRAEHDGETGSDVINYVDFIIEKAINFGASDIHFEVFRDGARVRVRRDGVLQEIEESNPFLAHNYSAISTRIKILANLNISERRLPQDGGIAYDTGSKTVDIRVSILPTAHGERVVMRILDPEAANFTLDQLGFPEDILKKIRKAIHAPQGMILVTGPTGSGKSTTLYAILKELNHDGVNILTAEDPVEFYLAGVGQVHVKESIGLTFTEALRSFLRQDPEIIMVGEIRDKDTSDIAIKAALTGHLVLSTLHTNSAPSTITRMVNMGVPAYLINSALSLVMAQRLARVICSSCKTEDTSHNKETFLSLGFEESGIKGLKAYKGAGCEKCNNRGIKGRRGIYEVLPINDAIKDAIMAGKSDLDIKKIAQKDGFVTMQEVGRQLIREGVISVEEYQRILVLE